MMEMLTAGSARWLAWLALLMGGAGHLSGLPAQSDDFRLNNLERQVDQLRMRVDQLERLLSLQRSEPVRPESSLDASRILSLERRQELISGRLLLLEKAWQTTEATVQQLMKEREAGDAGKKKTPTEEKTPPRPAKPPDGVKAEPRP